jgi:hypothetical protein
LFPSTLQNSQAGRIRGIRVRKEGTGRNRKGWIGCEQKEIRNFAGRGKLLTSLDLLAIQRETERERERERKKERERTRGRERRRE